MNGNGKVRQVSIARSRLRLWWTTSAIPQPQHHHQHGPRANTSRTEAPSEHHNIVRTLGDSSGYIWNHPSNHPSKLIVHEMSKYINKSRMKALTNQAMSGCFIQEDKFGHRHVHPKTQAGNACKPWCAIAIIAWAHAPGERPGVAKELISWTCSLAWWPS